MRSLTVDLDERIKTLIKISGQPSELLDGSSDLILDSTQAIEDDGAMATLHVEQ